MWALRNFRALVLAFFSAFVFLRYFAANRRDAARRLDCFQLRIGMPEAELLKRMGPPAEKILGDTLTSWMMSGRGSSLRDPWKAILFLIRAVAGERTPLLTEPAQRNPPVWKRQGAVKACVS